MKQEFKEIENLLSIVKSRIDAHLKFKNEYNKQLAFDFSMFQFFSIDENKISQVLAYFLDVNQNHGQGNLFLNEFLLTFFGSIKEIKQIENICEKVISNKRRIDIYIQLSDITIAIENKIWADDQFNQLKDYSNYLERKSNGKYILFYLNPYGLEPNEKSIKTELKEKLTSQNKLKILGYKQHIIPLINKWLAICEADNVTYFLKEFKKYLEVKFLGKNTINMSKELREIIYSNEQEVLTLVNEFKEIENEVLNKLNAIGKELEKIHPDLSQNIELSKSGLFNWSGTRVYKYSLSKGSNKIWIQFVKQDIHLISNYYLQEGTDNVFKEILTQQNINVHTRINHKLNINELINIFLEQVKIVNDSFHVYEENYKTEY
jgi:hypothetical protein